MKLQFSLLAFSALLLIVACGDDKPTTIDSEDLVKFVEGTYDGYTSAEFEKENPVIELNESIILKDNGDGAVNVSYISEKWGEFVISNAEVSDKGTNYSVSGKGKVQLVMPGKEKKEYDLNLEGTVSKDKKMATFVFNIPSATEGGAKITFYMGDLPPAEIIQGTYIGNLNASIMGMPQPPIEDASIIITNKNNGKATVTLVGFSLSASEESTDTESMVFKDVDIEVSEEDIYSLSGKIDTTSGSIKVTGNISGTIVNNEANITFEMETVSPHISFEVVFKGIK